MTQQKTALIQMICDKLRSEEARLREAYEKSGREGVGTRYFYIDNLLPESIAHQIYASFPESKSMRLIDTLRERKFTTKDLKKANPILEDITFAFQAPEVIACIESITKTKNQLPDPYLYAGGLSAMEKTHFLGAHIDNSHESTRQYYRRLNVLYYVSPDWKTESGGHLTLWDRPVRKRVTVESRFNRLVVMETNKFSWHSVSEVKADGKRTCVSNYYFSKESPHPGEEYFHVTSFSAPPEQPLRRAYFKFDTALRTLARKVFKTGLGKKDLYESASKL